MTRACNRDEQKREPSRDTHYQQVMEQRLGMPLPKFTLDYLRRGERRASVSRRTGIPITTLRNWEKKYVVITTFCTEKSSEPDAPSR